MWNAQDYQQENGWYRPKPAGGGGGSVTWTPTANPPLQAGGSNPQVFNTVAIGTAAANRYVIVAAAESNNGPFTACTANGGAITFTKASDGFNGASMGVSLWYANVPSGTSLTDISLTSTTTFANFVGIAVGTILTATPTPNSTATELAASFITDPQVTTSGLTVLTNGIGIVAAATTTPATATWNTGTQDYSIVSGTGFQLLLGHLSSSGTPSISGYSFTNFSIAAASWGP